MSGLVRRIGPLVAALCIVAAPIDAEAGGLDAPTGTGHLQARLDLNGGAVGVTLPVGPTSGWVTGTFDARLLGTSLLAGVQYPLVDGPKYRLDAWSELGPRVSFRGLFAAGANAELGLRNIFGTPPVRWSAGAGFDSAFLVVPEAEARYRPEGALGLGVEGTTPPIVPDRAWIRGTVGYDVRPARIGAIHGDIWLALQWSLVSNRR